nr:MAG TPA: hypothetical protein [Caudoviricetes sp.]
MHHTIAFYSHGKQRSVWGCSGIRFNTFRNVSQRNDPGFQLRIDVNRKRLPAIRAFH